ncbi:hypothetical protein CXB51_025623 [Gossypium anomalum]|uniref:Uncharacterized protein n=1 Tax=Gossypium anomalum TaxID=47600 RepID=A0A8J5YAK3_9ROSI|nr:hypothetical protein CXB51_025623 [Gossypium anomalum]
MFKKERERHSPFSFNFIFFLSKWEPFLASSQLPPPLGKQWWERNDLLIVGPGVLGRLVAEKWREVKPNQLVDCLNIIIHCSFRGTSRMSNYGQTVTTDHHNELISLGINPFLKETKTDQKFPYVLFFVLLLQKPQIMLVILGNFLKIFMANCHSPVTSHSIRLAALSWNGEGSFVFTSSSAPYDCNDNGPCDEDTPTVPMGRSPRTDTLLKAEKVVLEFDGCVVRGAHFYWLHKGTVDARPDHILNLIHYEDAASLSVTILKKKLRGRIFLGCDNHPLSRQEVMDLVDKSGNLTKSSKALQGEYILIWVWGYGSPSPGTSDPLGKKLNNSNTRKELGWEPKYPSFAHFLGVSK